MPPGTLGIETTVFLCTLRFQQLLLAGCGQRFRSERQFRRLRTMSAQAPSSIITVMEQNLPDSCNTAALTAAYLAVSFFNFFDGTSFPLMRTSVSFPSNFRFSIWLAANFHFSFVKFFSMCHCFSFRTYCALLGDSLAPRP